MEVRKKGTKEAPKETKQKGKKSKGPTKRSKSSLRGLEKRFYSKIKQEYFDMDYLPKLNEADSLWMSKFMNEHLGANIKESNEAPLHNTKELTKKVFDANNERNRDVYGRAKAMGRTVDTIEQPSDESYSGSSNSIEDVLIDLIDSKRADKH